LWAIHSLASDDIDSNNPIILGSDELGKKGIRSEIVGEKCAHTLLNEIKTNSPVDEHLADNLIPYLAFFGGKIKASNISKHLRSNIYVLEKFGYCFKIDEENKIIEKNVYV
jgi:RNA 3'-terminal phosphate cyclase